MGNKDKLRKGKYLSNCNYATKYNDVCSLSAAKLVNKDVYISRIKQNCDESDENVLFMAVNT